VGFGYGRENRSKEPLSPRDNVGNVSSVPGFSPARIPVRTRNPVSMFLAAKPGCSRIRQRSTSGYDENGLGMNVVLTQELERRLAEKVERGEVQSADLLIEQAVAFYLDYEAGAMDEQELRETQAAIDEAREQSRQGQAIPAKQVFAEFRAKHGILR